MDCPVVDGWATVGAAAPSGMTPAEDDGGGDAFRIQMKAPTTISAKALPASQSQGASGRRDGRAWLRLVGFLLSPLTSGTVIDVA